MPRSATDATRFTSTGPHASFKGFTASNVSSAGSNSGAGGPASETPQQKVQRLRAAAQRARDAKISSGDRIVNTGRVLADRAHRITGFTLIGITVFTAMFSVYSLIDMSRYNRKKKAEYFAQQKQLLDSAVEAFQAGTVTQEQIELLEKEGKIVRTPKSETQAEEVVIAAGEPKSKTGIVEKSKGWLFSGLKKDENDSSSATNSSGVLQAVEDKTSLAASTVREAFDNERAKEISRQQSGGPLDNLGTTSAASDTKASKGWWSSLTGR